MAEGELSYYDENNKLVLRIFYKNGEPDISHKKNFLRSEFKSIVEEFIDAIQEEKYSHTLD